MNITELSKHLGISVSTISKALNGYSGVSEKTRELVKRAAKETGYHPLASARNLRRRDTERIGLLNPTMGNGEWEQRIVGEHFLRILGGVVAEAERHQKDIVLYTTQPMAKPEIIERIANSKEVDGLIVLGSKLPREAVQIIQSTGMPFVLHGKDVGIDRLSFVMPDMVQAGYLATKHLLELGHRRIAYVGQSVDFDSDHLRQEGYRQALAEFGLVEHPDLKVDSEFREDGGGRAMQELFSRGVPFTAAVFYSDGLYFEALHCCRDKMLDSDGRPLISAIGMDNTYRARFSDPGLSSIHLPIEQMGARAVSMLMDLFNAPAGTAFQEALPVSLIVRGSSVAL